MRYSCNRQSDLYMYHNCDMNELGKRLRDARNARGLTQKELSRKSGVSQATISDIERGRNESSKELPALAKALGESLDCLVSGRQSQLRHGDFMPVSVWDEPDDLDPDQHVVVPRVQVRFSAGNGHDVSFEPDTHDKGNAYRLDWIRRKGLDPKRLIVVIIDGESMAPTLPHGSAMTTDTRKNTLDQVVDGKVYAIRYGNELRVKRLRKRFDGALLIDSDNPEYPREVVDPHQLEHIGIIGAYVAHSYDGDI